MADLLKPIRIVTVLELFKFQYVCERYRIENRLQVVLSVGALTDNVQSDIDFAKRILNHNVCIILL